MYYVVYYYTKNLIASLIASIIYAFNPLVSAHLQSGHIQLMGRYFLPLLFLFAHRYIFQPTYRHAALFWLVFTLNALTSIHFLLLASAVLLGLPLAHLVFTKAVFSKEYMLCLAKTSLVLVIFLPPLIYFNGPYMTFSRKEGVVRTLREGLFSAAYPLDWLLSTPDSFLYGQTARAIEPQRYPKETVGSRLSFNYAEHTLFLNIAPLALVSYGIWCFVRSKKSAEISRDKKLFLISCSIIMLLSIAFTSGQIFSIAYNIFPFLQGIRAPTRFVFMLYVPFAMFEGIAVASLANRKKSYAVIVCALIVILFIENRSGYRYEQTSIQIKEYEKKTTQLAFLNGKQTFHLPYPIQNVTSGHYLNFASLTEENMLNGYSGYFPPDWSRLVLEINSHFNERALEKLAALDINFVIIHKDLLDKKQLHDIANIQNKGATVYEDKKLVVLDVGKYGLKIKICKKDKDFFIKSVKEKILLTNLRNCYLSSKFEKRYSSIIIMKGGKVRRLEIKFPLLISPFEKIELQKL